MNVEVETVIADEPFIVIGVPVPDIIQFLFPAFKVVAAVSPDFPIVKVATVILPLPPVCVVTVSPVEAVEFENIKLSKLQLLVPEVVPKFLAAPILCSKVPFVMLTVPVPVTLPFTVIVPVPPEVEKLPETLKSCKTLKVLAVVVVPEIVR